MKVMLLSQDATVPARATAGAAGFDLCSAEDVVVPPVTVVGERARVGRTLVKTGIAVAIPDGFVGRVGSRSGLSVAHNIEVGAGWVDSDYRGEVCVELKNFGHSPFTIVRGARIAQLILLRIVVPEIEVVTVLPVTSRGSQGFGSTGIT